ncbi:RNA polymerase sigma factor [Chryseobacterium wanjuense]
MYGGRYCSGQFHYGYPKNHQLEDKKALFGWLKKIVINNALMHLRKHNKEVFVTTETSEIPDIYSEMNHPSLDEKHIFIYDFTREQLLSSIDNLPEHHKSVFNLFFIENYSHAEISSALGITINTSKSHLMRAKKSVQNFLTSHFVNQDTPKNKKMAQLLIIFGLGGLLWAQTFRSKFADFSIFPSKKLEIPKNIGINATFSLTSTGSWKNKMIMGATVLVIIAGSVVLLSPKNSLLKNSTNSKETTVKKEKISQNIHFQSENATVNGNLSEQNTGTNEVEKTEVIPTEKITEIKSNSKKIIIKDSIKETPQKVIVVKKIIQRDTVFIEK